MNKKMRLLSSVLLMSVVVSACSKAEQAKEETSVINTEATTAVNKKEVVSKEQHRADINLAITNFNDAKSLKVTYKDGLSDWAYSGIMSYDAVNNKFIVIEQNKQEKLSVYYDRKNDEFFTLTDGKDVSDDYSQSIPLVQLADRRVEMTMNFFKTLAEYQEGDLPFEVTPSGDYQFIGKKSALATAVKKISTDNGKDNVKNIDGKDLTLLLTINTANEITAIKISGHLIINYKDNTSEEGELNTEYMIANYNQTGVKFEKATKDKSVENTSEERSYEN